MIATRRHFVRRAAALGAATLARRLLPLASLGVPAVQAASSEDYRALVCVFLFGGADGNSLLVPLDSGGYARYSAVRTVASGLNIPQAQWQTIEPAGLGPFGLHPDLAPLRPLFSGGDLALLANVGPLTRPTSKRDYASARPDNLYSHSDQQSQWQSAVSRGASPSGWGGRIADALGAVNGSFPVVTSVAGATLFISGGSSRPLAVPASGGLALQGFNTSAASTARLNALKAILAAEGDNAYVRAAAETNLEALALAGKVNPILSATNASVAPLFAGQTSSIAQQLLQVAKMIEGRAQTGARRQVFFVSMGGFDTHTNELNQLSTLLGQLAPALRSFHDATQELGIADKVTTFTLSDFGRTFQPASGGGSDHAWGNHHLVMGGAVRGGRIFGTYPELVLDGPDDAEKEGRWIPTTSVDQYGATLARWMGLDERAIDKAFPNLATFGARDLGFLA